MQDYFPIFSCILVGSVVVCCCVRHYRRRQRQQQQQQQQQQDQETLYSAIPIDQPKASAPPMQAVYEYEEGDPVV
jgi:hypothetical protein